MRTHHLLVPKDHQASGFAIWFVDFVDGAITDLESVIYAFPDPPAGESMAHIAAPLKESGITLDEDESMGTPPSKWVLETG